MYWEFMQKRVEKVVLDSYKSMYRIARTFVGNEKEAFDIVQDSVYKAARSTEKVKSQRYIRTWVYKIVLERSMDFLMKNQKEISLEELFDVYEWGIEGHHQNLDMKRALGILSDRERAVIILHYFEGRELEEIGMILNANMGTVRSLLYRSLENLETEMGKDRMEHVEKWLEEMRKNYEDIDIPSDLKKRVDRGIKQAKADSIRQQNSVNPFHIFKQVLN
ncbi:MAG: sigma-70 family RNA polymerase sigma factor [Lachnospiraceae bacterium]|nr:sigma-70 family RNA polymerase sigma factor [Lachnospiraceae bacterium]